MKVDIIIPSYHGIYLTQTLDSCFNQSYKDFNITVIDNCSKFDIKKICQSFKNVNYIRAENNLGPAGGRNLGIKSTSGELISFIDDDDLMERDKLFYSVNEFKKNKNLGMTCGNYQILVNRSKLLNPFYKVSPVINWNTLMKQNYVASGSTTIKRAIIDEVGLFDEQFWIGEDYDYWLRISEKFEIKYIPKVLYYYSKVSNGNSLTDRADIQKDHLKNLEIIKKASLKRKSINGQNI